METTADVNYEVNKLAFAIDEHGREPDREFLTKLHEQHPGCFTSFIVFLLEICADDKRLRPPQSKYLGKQIFEFRFMFNGLFVRILWFYKAGIKMLACGYLKKSNKLNKGKFEQAVAMRKLAMNS